MRIIAISQKRKLKLREVRALVRVTQLTGGRRWDLNRLCRLSHSAYQPLRTAQCERHHTLPVLHMGKLRARKVNRLSWRWNTGIRFPRPLVLRATSFIFQS